VIVRQRYQGTIHEIGREVATSRRDFDLFGLGWLLPGAAGSSATNSEFYDTAGTDEWGAKRSQQLQGMRGIR